MVKTIPIAFVCQQNRLCNRNRRNTRDWPREKPFLQRARLTLSVEIGDLG